MTDSYDLSKLGSDAFENIVNFLALKTLGLGSTGFGPGADGGRDGYFEGEAPYPSETERWNGVWYIQSKFHKPHLSNDPQKWLVSQVKLEIEKFDDEGSDRKWPDNWIISTNIDQSGKPDAGSFDLIRKLLDESDGGKEVNLDVWGGRKILDMLALHDDVAKYYGHLLTPGHVISALYDALLESHASIKEIVQYFIATQFSDHTFSKLDQAGSSSDDRPAVHDLFIDLPFSTEFAMQQGLLGELCKASAQCHKYSLLNEFPESWKNWNKRSMRARVVLVKGGPGQGKSTIGQYFCQIHRAALILSDDGPPVIDSSKDLALAVRSAAERDGFWPASARIPIQVELKEFAHWYSQRGSNQPKGVLNYLAEIVANRIGCDVRAKTIKRALAERSWVVIFDGLDEVPNDSKTTIADEVLFFLNNVLVEIDGDVLSLCSSRPQGYSGQFSGLDGPIVKLSLLDADTAMLCAKPLLRFGRTKEESDKSIKILETAILSPNVQELMTTPLQSHIMAVIVRDGGRPPERRWQLFNSFYLVMKKRESQKDFQNQRISKLLREEDVLLKSVHMRLGFVLHAQAERSIGAQTTLSKEDFRSLVNDVVTELNEHNISETVDDVMEATTERLVLVSTPENGEHVRFDIRQLQEFFAAEFLYTGVDSKELAGRIETIGGDEHWREVMHFLMSALIENQRTTDVAVAVQELRRLNEGEGPGNLYRRRMAKGVLLAGRLLLEGVLEQDQRVRQRIKPLFDPIGGRFDIQSLQDLVNIKPMSSRHWLIQQLLEKIETANSQEYIGVLYLLAWLLPDDHLDVKKVSEAFFKASISYQEKLLKSWCPNEGLIFSGSSYDHKKTDYPLSQWVVEVAIKILNSSYCIQYSPDTIKHLLNICHAEKDRFTSIFNENGVSDGAAKAIAQCLEYKRPHDSDASVDCGVLTVSIYPEHWCNGAIPKQLIGIDSKKYLKDVGGVFRLMLVCSWFAEEQCDAALLEVVSICDVAGEKLLEALPGFLLALLPVPGLQTLKPCDIEHLRGLDAGGIGQGASIAKAQGFQAPAMAFTVNQTKKTTSQQDWKPLMSRFPGIITNIVFLSATDRVFDWGKKEAALEAISLPEIRAILQKNPVKTIQNISDWGILSEQYPDLLCELKNNAIDILPHTFNSYWGKEDVFFPFTIQFPEDAPLISLISLIAQLFIQADERRIRNRGLVTPELSFKDAFLLYGMTEEELRTIAESDEYDQIARSGALALYWLLLTETSQTGGVEMKLDLIHEKNLYAELVDETNEKWLTHALVKGVLINSLETDDNTIALVTCLMERCNDGGGPQDALLELLTNWQEKSTAPVNRKGVMKQWLGYNFDVPSYAY